MLARAGTPARPLRAAVAAATWQPVCRLSSQRPAQQQPHQQQSQQPQKQRDRGRQQPQHQPVSQKRQAQQQEQELQSSARPVTRPLGLRLRGPRHVVASGSNSLGNLGVPDKRAEGPLVVEALEGKNILDVASSWTRSVALTENNEAWIWGPVQQVRDMVRKERRKQGSGIMAVLAKDWGQLFDNDGGWEPRPLDMSAVPEGYHLVRVEAGGSHFAALSDSGYVWVWGENFAGQLGVGKALDLLRVREPRYLPVGQPHEDLTKDSKISRHYLANTASVRIVDVALGYQHSLFLQDTGTVWVSGKGAKGELGLAQRPMDPISLPRALQASNRGELPANAPVLGRVRAVAAGQAHSLFLDFDHNLWASGDNKLGALGIGNFVNQNWPVPVGGPLAGTQVTKAVCGHSHSAALTRGGEVYAWGSNVVNQCTYNTREDLTGFPATPNQRALVTPARLEMPVIAQQAWEEMHRSQGQEPAPGPVLPATQAWCTLPADQPDLQGLNMEAFAETTGYSTEALDTDYLPVDELFDIVDLQVGFYDTFLRLRDGSLLSLGGGKEGIDGLDRLPVLTHMNPEFRPELCMKRPEFWPRLRIQLQPLPAELRAQLTADSDSPQGADRLELQHLSPSFMHTLWILGRPGDSGAASQQ